MIWCIYRHQRLNRQVVCLDTRRWQQPCGIFRLLRCRSGERAQELNRWIEEQAKNWVQNPW